MSSPTPSSVTIGSEVWGEGLNFPRFHWFHWLPLSSLIHSVITVPECDDRKYIPTTKFPYERKKVQNTVTCLDKSSWGHNEWRLSLCVVHLTKAQSANIVNLVWHQSPSRPRYTQHWQGMLFGMLGRSVRGFFDRWHSLCSVEPSTVYILLQEVTLSSSNTTVNVIPSKIHKNNRTYVNM